MEKQSTFIVVDGNSLVNRAFYALPPLTNPKGVPTQAVYGFATMLTKAIVDYRPDYLAVAFDLPEATFRHKKYDGYKATRKKMPDELAVQIPLLKEMLISMRIPILEKAGFEADDILGTMAKRADGRVYIVTGDRDALQLIDGNIRVLLTKRGLSEIAEYDEQKLLADYRLTPAQIVEYKALCGDASDNIPGVAGVGDKTATQLLLDYGSLDGVYQNIESVPGKLKEKLMQGKALAYLSRELAAIDTAVPIEKLPADCAYPYPFPAEVKQFFIENAFKSLIKRDDLFAIGDGCLSVSSVSIQSDAQTIRIESAAALHEVLADAAESGSIAVCIGESVCFSFSPDTEYSVSLSYTLIDPGLDIGTVLSVLKAVLENNNIQKTVFDAKAFKKTIAPFAIQLHNYFDVKLAQYVVDSSAANDPASLSASGLFLCKTELEKELRAQNRTALYSEIELPLTDVLFRMEREGFKVDTAELQRLGDDFSKRSELLSQEIQNGVGYPFNVNSPKQLAKALFIDMEIPYPKKSRDYSTAAEILELIEDRHPVIQKILNYRFLTKLNGTYVEGLLRAADTRGIVRTDFKQTLTATGRLSSTEPNLQNIPIRVEEGRLLRKVFVPKNPSGVLVTADYSQIELRLMAHLSGDENMIEAFLSGEDIHATTAAGVFGVPLSAVTPKMRQEAKAVNFGIIYGISDFGLAKNIGVPVSTAKKYIENYFIRFPKIKDYMESAVAIAKKKGYAETLFGRIRKIPELLSSNYNTRSFGERVAMNTPLQGTAADIIKIAMNRVDRALTGKKSKLILQVHDELIVDADEEEAEEVLVIIKQGMEKAANLRVPLYVETGRGRNWYACK